MITGMRRVLGVTSALALVLLTAPAASARSYVQDDSLEDTVAVNADPGSYVDDAETDERLHRSPAGVGPLGETGLSPTSSC